MDEDLRGADADELHSGEVRGGAGERVEYGGSGGRGGGDEGGEFEEGGGAEGEGGTGCVGGNEGAGECPGVVVVHLDADGVG